MPSRQSFAPRSAYNRDIGELDLDEHRPNVRAARDPPGRRSDISHEGNTSRHARARSSSPEDLNHGSSEERDQVESPPRGGANGEQRVRPGSAPEPDMSMGNGSRKRQLTQEIADYTANRNSKKHNSDTGLDFQTLQHLARDIPRRLGPFLNIASAFLGGIEVEVRLKSEPVQDRIISEKDKAVLDTYHKILEIVPGLSQQVKWCIRNSVSAPSTTVQLATFLEQAANKGRSDDCGTLRDHGLRYIPIVEGIPRLEAGVSKTERGFSHLSTARLLCPRYLRDEFDADMKGFCRDMQNAEPESKVSDDDWPSFLYPEDNYDLGAIDKGLLRGPFLLSCFRHLFTGARTALKATPGKAPGKKCLADLYNMTKVTPQHIAYVAVICRHVLNGADSWTVRDGSFLADSFYTNIVDLFKFKQWAEETLNWWNEQVFGNDPRLQENTARPQNRITTVSLVAMQRAARQAAADADAAAAAASAAGSGSE